VLALVDAGDGDPEGRFRMRMGGGWLSGRVGVVTEEEAPREMTSAGIGWCSFVFLSRQRNIWVVSLMEDRTMMSR
jgi:hypothetical protein